MTDRYPPCPVCGSPSDFCQGHGEIVDPAGFARLEELDDTVPRCARCEQIGHAGRDCPTRVRSS